MNREAPHRPKNAKQIVSALNNGDPCEVPRGDATLVFDVLDSMYRVRVKIELDEYWIKLTPY